MTPLTVQESMYVAMEFVRKNVQKMGLKGVPEARGVPVGSAGQGAVAVKNVPKEWCATTMSVTHRYHVTISV